MDRFRHAVAGAPLDSYSEVHRMVLRQQLQRLRSVFNGVRPEAVGDLVFFMLEALPDGAKGFVNDVGIVEFVLQGEYVRGVRRSL